MSKIVLKSIHYDCLMYIPLQFIYLYVQSPVKFLEWEAIASGEA